jgi:hypothetical protein
MPKCEGIIPEKTIPVRSVVLVDEAGNAIFDEDGNQVKEIIYETTPAHPCDAEATMLSRSMREREDGSWEVVGDALYCASCFVPGTMTHRDGRVTDHLAMALSDA